MRKKGCRFEFWHERDAALLRAYRRVMSTYPGELRSLKAVAGVVCGENAPRFFVTPERALRVVYMMLRGVRLDRVIPERKRMYDEIFRRAMDMQRLRPGMKMKHIVERVVEQPAPSFYMTQKSMYVALCRLLR